VRGKHVGVLAVAIALSVASLPSAADAFPPNGGTETTKLSMPANSTGTAETSELPPKVKSGTIDVTLDSNDDAFFDTLTSYLLLSKPTFGARVISCVFLYAGLLNSSTSEANITIKEPTLQLLFLNVCIRLAAVLSKPRTTQSTGSTAAGCRTTSKAVAARITRWGSGFAVTVSGKAFTPRSRSPVLISCRRSARALSISMRPRSKAATLQQVVRSKLGIGFSNLSTHSGRIGISFTVK
jgi:hypothetical protein